jgi:transcriptional regulator GlxA family with amidase domain
MQVAIVVLLDFVGGDASLPVRNLIARTRERGTTIASACAGTFLLAEAGILDGLRATTTWWLSPAFRARYPRVELDHSQMVITCGGITTAGAAFGHIDLALSIVRVGSVRLGPEVRREAYGAASRGRGQRQPPGRVQRRDQPDDAL